MQIHSSVAQYSVVLYTSGHTSIYILCIMYICDRYRIASVGREWNSGGVDSGPLMHEQWHNTRGYCLSSDTIPEDMSLSVWDTLTN